MAEEEPPAIEFRSPEDDAWYAARLSLSGDRLTVGYIDFPDSGDELYLAGSFGSLRDLEDFEKRFRPRSVRLQERDCHRAIEGLIVCASNLFPEDNSIRFYDACIEDVQYRPHSFDNGEENCLCNFLLFWQHGPLAGEKTFCTIPSLCLIRPTIKVNPSLESIIRIAREKILSAAHSSSSNHDATLRNGNACLKDVAAKNKSCLSHFQVEETNVVEQVGKATQESPGGAQDYCRRSDMDCGGPASCKNIEEASSHHVILIENLETDLTPPTIAKFLDKWISISPRAYVFPTSSESYTEGVILLDTKEELEITCCFVNSPDHIVTSFSGRPWVMTGKKLRPETIKMILRLESQGKLQSEMAQSHRPLKIVKLGSEEYKVAQSLKDLYIDFITHMQRLQKKLAWEEAQIWGLASPK